MTLPQSNKPGKRLSCKGVTYSASKITLLLNLMTATFAGKADNKLKLLTCILTELKSKHNERCLFHESRTNDVIIESRQPNYIIPISKNHVSKPGRQRRFTKDYHGTQSTR